LKISLNTTTFIIQYNLEEAIERASKLGYRFVEICGDRPHGWPEDINKNERKRVLGLAESNSVKIESVSTGFMYYLQPGFAHWKAAVRDQGAKYVKDLIELAYDLNAKKVTLIPGRTLSNVPFQKAWIWSVKKISECADFARDREIILGLENLVNSNEITNTPENLLKIINYIKKDNLGVTLDLGHVNVVGIPVKEFVEKLGKLIVNVHVHDNDGSGDAHLQPGKGNIDFRAAIDSLRQAGYDGCLTLEVAAAWQWSSDECDRAAIESREFLEHKLE